MENSSKVMNPLKKIKVKVRDTTGTAGRGPGLPGAGQDRPRAWARPTTGRGPGPPARAGTAGHGLGPPPGVDKDRQAPLTITSTEAKSMEPQGVR